MKYSALLMILSGFVIACFAGVHYASGGPAERAENPFVLGLALPLVFAAALVIVGSALLIAGAAMWFVGRRDTVSEPASGRCPAGASGE